MIQHPEIIRILGREAAGKIGKCADDARRAAMKITGLLDRVCPGPDEKHADVISRSFRPA